jgi:hypothetical protein
MTTHRMSGSPQGPLLAAHGAVRPRMWVAARASRIREGARGFVHASADGRCPCLRDCLPVCASCIDSLCGERGWTMAMTCGAVCAVARGRLRARQWRLCMALVRVAAGGIAGAR